MEPLNYPITNPDGSVNPAYPIDPRYDALLARLKTLEEGLDRCAERIAGLEKFLGPKPPY